MASSHCPPSAPRKSTSAKKRVFAYLDPPPEPEDIEWFRQRRRKEITRRAFVVGGIAAGIGLAVLPFLPWGGDKPGPQFLLTPEAANADPQLIRQLCLLYYQHPDVRIRKTCLAYMMQFSDATVRQAIWDRARQDPDESARTRALEAIVAIGDSADVATLVQLARSNPSARAAITNAAMMLGNAELSTALQQP